MAASVTFQHLNDWWGHSGIETDLSVKAPDLAVRCTAAIAVAIGVPAETLRRRPDVRSAERQLAVQFALVNVARADLYPTFRLAGSMVSNRCL